MNPNQLTDQLGLFLDVLETGSFSAASRRHPLTPSAVARRIDSLESAVGSQLFIRSTHAVRATPGGMAFAERARRIVAELRLARAEAVSLSSAPEGLIRIDAPAAFGRRHLAPVIADFLLLYPGLDVQLQLIDSFRRHAGLEPGQGRPGVARRAIGRYAVGGHAAGEHGAHRLRQPRPTCNAAACRMIRRNWLSMMAWTGPAWPLPSPGVSNGTARCSCIGRRACA